MIKILVAEDEARSRAALASRLRSILGEAALIETAADGNEAVTKAVQVKPDLIFMDIEMPYKNGLEAAAVVKSQMPETHVVFLTAYDRFDYAVGALRSGGEDYLLKPASEADLREMLQKFFDVAPQVPKDATPFEAALRVWLHQHYTEDVALEAAAESMGMSPFYFSRQVKAATGQTFLELFTGYRIEKAKPLLLSEGATVLSVSLEVGFDDPSYFSKVFKRVTGMSPGRFRETGGRAALKGKSVG